jgi:hypothetical protein
MRAVWKITLQIDGMIEIGMPRGAQALAVQTQHGQPQLWALVDTEAPYETRQFRIAGTGHPIDESVGAYVGTFQLHGGALVFHVFECSP